MIKPLLMFSLRAKFHKDWAKVGKLSFVSNTVIITGIAAEIGELLMSRAMRFSWYVSASSLSSSCVVIILADVIVEGLED